jgi:hypothetical protein
VLYKLKLYNESIKYIKIAVKKGGENNADIFDHYGDIAFCCGKNELAKSCWKTAIKLGGDSLKLSLKIKDFRCE